jgi:hypothetical protein
MSCIVIYVPLGNPAQGGSSSSHVHLKPRTMLNLLFYLKSVYFVFMKLNSYISGYTQMKNS